MQLNLYNVRLVAGSGLPIKIPVLSSLSGIKGLGAVSFKTEEVNCMLVPNYHLYTLRSEVSLQTQIKLAVVESEALRCQLCEVRRH